MKRTEIKQSLRRSMGVLPRPDFDYIANAPIHRMQEHDYITRQEEPGAKSMRTARAAITSVCLATCMLVFGLFGFQNWMEYQTIDLDVNPSFEITTNRKNEVIKVKGINEEAQAILADDYRGQSLSDTLNRILAAIDSGGYLEATDNAVLVSVSAAGDAAPTGKEISETVQSALSDLGIPGSVYTQELIQAGEIESQAQALGISQGKMQLIQVITGQLDGYSAEKLAGYTIADLVEIIQREGLKTSLQSTASPTAGGEEESTAPVDPSVDFHDVDGKARLDEIIRGYQEIGALFANNADGRYDDEIRRRLRELENALNQLGDDYAAVGREYADFYRDKYEKVGESYAEKYESYGESYAQKYRDFANDIVDRYRP